MYDADDEGREEEVAVEEEKEDRDEKEGIESEGVEETDFLGVFLDLYVSSSFNLLPSPFTLYFISKS